MTDLRRILRGLGAAFFFASSKTVSAITWDGCTSIVVSSGATQDGSALTSHANDCSDCDWRVVPVPAKDHAPGSMRKVYDAVWDQYPRLVDTDRAELYHAAAGVNSSKVLGEIPQVAHTYALWEASYGLMNEKGVGMGESTCFGLLSGKGIADGGTALFTVGNLMAVALERCDNARCAIRTMGDLAERYGFYGEDDGPSGAGETVTVVDKSGESWVFHILGGLPEKEGSKYAGRRGALWAAQRVPDGHVAVVANAFIIREVHPEDTENFIVHDGLFELAQEAGLWDGVGTFDFVATMMPDMTSFKVGAGYVNYMINLRMWGVYRKAAPSLHIPLDGNQRNYPFSVPVDKKVSHLDVMDWFRDHYEGTEYDMTMGVQAGPFGSPNRITGGTGALEIPGQYARGISLHWTSYTVLLQSGGSSQQPVAWFAPDTSSSSVFVPFFANALKSGGDGRYDQPTYGRGSLKTFAFGATGGEDGLPAPAWWAFDFVANWMELTYSNMSKTYVFPAVEKLQRQVADAVAVSATPESTNSDLADVQTRVQREVVTNWWKFAEQMVVRYNDRMFNFGENDPTAVHVFGLPTFWLEMSGYGQDSYKPQWVAPTVEVPKKLPEEQLTELKIVSTPVGESFAETTTTPAATGGFGFLSVVGFVLVSAVVGAFGGSTIGYNKGRKDEKKVSSTTAPYFKINA